MLNFAILSAGNIAGRMARTLDSLRDEVQPYAIAARDSARAQALAGRYGFAKSFAGYEALLADPAVDVVYIGSIHPLHAQHIRAALLAGKHVLCEKPLTLNAAQAQSLFALARERGLLLAEAMWTRTLPFAQALCKTLADGRLGAPRLVTAVLGEAMADIPRIAQPALGGGALLDIGVYALTLACLALEGDVERVGGVCVQNGLGADIEESISLRFSGGACASLAVSARCAAPHRAAVCCGGGRIEIDGPLWSPAAMTVYGGTGTDAGGKMPRPMFRSLLFILASVFFWFFGYNAVTSAFSRYAEQELQGNFALVLMICTVAAIVSYMPVGMIAQRIGRKRTILIGVVMLGTAFFAGIFFHSVSPLLYIFFALAGMGWAFINVNSYPMVVELSKGSDVGKYTGYYYTVSMTAQIFTPILSNILMEHVGYRTLFPYAAFFVFASFVTMLFVRHGDARPVAKKGLEALDVDD